MRLKTRIERQLIEGAVCGRDVLDVGIGTGRASIPLARAGYAVTGIDSSQPMLDQCRVEASGVEMTLLRGDLADLPLTTQSFDTVVSLNCLLHFPHWQDVLKEWSRVVRPNGRLIFDLHSLDHIDAVSESYGVAPQALIGREQDDKFWYVTRVRAQELVEYAAAIGLRPIGLHPYAAVLGGGNANYWLWKALASGPFYERLLSWTALNDRMQDFAFAIEQFMGCLSTGATGRFMTIFEKADPRDVGRRWIQRDRALRTLLKYGDASALCRLIDADADTVTAQLRHHLGDARCLTFFSILCAAIPGDFWMRFIRPLLTEAHRLEVERVRDGYRFDQTASAFLASLDAEKFGVANATFQGVDLANIARYEIGHALVAEGWLNDNPGL